MKQCYEDMPVGILWKSLSWGFVLAFGVLLMLGNFFQNF